MNDAEVLDRLLEGDLPARDDVPEHVGRLAVVADLIVEASMAAQPVQMRREARDDLRLALIREANLRAAAPPPLLSRMRDRLIGVADRWRYSSRAALVGSTAAVVLSTGGVATATGIALPGDLFYGLKLSVEDVVLSFASAGVEHADGMLGRATRRIDEAALAADRSQHDVAGDALRLADEHTRAGAQEYLGAYLDGGDTEVLEELGSWVMTANRQLDLMPLLEGPAEDALADLRTTLNRIDQRIEVLTTGACTSCDLGVHDDPQAEPDTARGLEADGTPPVPGGAPVDLTVIPPADQPFQACPCVGVAPPGSATAEPAGSPAPTGSGTPPAASDPPAADPPANQSGGGGAGGGSSGGGGTAPLPDLDPVIEPLPDPVGDTLEEIIENLPGDPPEPPAEPAPANPAPQAPAAAPAPAADQPVDLPS